MPRPSPAPEARHDPRRRRAIGPGVRGCARDGGPLGRLRRFSSGAPQMRGASGARTCVGDAAVFGMRSLARLALGGRALSSSRNQRPETLRRGQGRAAQHGARRRPGRRGSPARAQRARRSQARRGISRARDARISRAMGARGDARELAGDLRADDKRVFKRRALRRAQPLHHARAGQLRAHFASKPRPGASRAGGAHDSAHPAGEHRGAAA